LGDRKGIQFVEDCIIKCILRRGNGEKKSRRGQLANHSHMEDGHQNGNGCFLGKHFNQVPSKFHFIIKKQV